MPSDGSPCADHAVAVVDAVSESLPRIDADQAANEPLLAIATWIGSLLDGEAKPIK